MCNLYALTCEPQVVLQFFSVSHNRAQAFTPKEAIFPGYTAPVVRMSADGERELVNLSWGFILPQAGKAAKRVTNTRDDKVLSSSFYVKTLPGSRYLFCGTKRNHSRYMALVCIETP